MTILWPILIGILGICGIVFVLGIIQLAIYIIKDRGYREIFFAVLLIVFLAWGIGVTLIQLFPGLGLPQ